MAEIAGPRRVPDDGLQPGRQRPHMGPAPAEAAGERRPGRGDRQRPARSVGGGDGHRGAVPALCHRDGARAGHGRRPRRRHPGAATGSREDWSRPRAVAAARSAGRARAALRGTTGRRGPVRGPGAPRLPTAGGTPRRARSTVPVFVPVSGLRRRARPGHDVVVEAGRGDGARGARRRQRANLAT